MSRAHVSQHATVWACSSGTSKLLSDQNGGGWSRVQLFSQYVLGGFEHLHEQPKDAGASWGRHCNRPYDTPKNLYDSLPMPPCLTPSDSDSRLTRYLSPRVAEVDSSTGGAPLLCHSCPPSAAPSVRHTALWEWYTDGRYTIGRCCRWTRTVRLHIVLCNMLGVDKRDSSLFWVVAFYLAQRKKTWRNVVICNMNNYWWRCYTGGSRRRTTAAMPTHCHAM